MDADSNNNNNISKKQTKKENQQPRKKNKPFSPLDDCDRPACDDITSMFLAAKTAMDGGDGDGVNSDKKKKPAVIQQEKKVECPPNSAELGTGTWTLLHSMVRGTKIR